MNYICIQDYDHIKKGDKVVVEIGAQVYITFNKRTICRNEFVLAMHFDKLYVLILS